MHYRDDVGKGVSSVATYVNVKNGNPGHVVLEYTVSTSCPTAVAATVDAAAGGPGGAFDAALQAQQYAAGETKVFTRAAAETLDVARGFTAVVLARPDAAGQTGDLVTLKDADDNTIARLGAAAGAVNAACPDGAGTVDAAGGAKLHNLVTLLYKHRPGITDSWSVGETFAASMGGRLPTKQEMLQYLDAYGKFVSQNMWVPIMNYDIPHPHEDWINVGQADPLSYKMEVGFLISWWDTTGDADGYEEDTSKRASLVGGTYNYVEYYFWVLTPSDQGLGVYALVASDAEAKVYAPDASGSFLHGGVGVGGCGGFGTAGTSGTDGALAGYSLALGGGASAGFSGLLGEAFVAPRALSRAELGLAIHGLAGYTGDTGADLVRWYTFDGDLASYHDRADRRRAAAENEAAVLADPAAVVTDALQTMATLSPGTEVYTPALARRLYALEVAAAQTLDAPVGGTFAWTGAWTVAAWLRAPAGATSGAVLTIVDGAASANVAEVVRMNNIETVGTWVKSALSENCDTKCASLGLSPNHVIMSAVDYSKIQTIATSLGTNCAAGDYARTYAGVPMQNTANGCYYLDPAGTLDTSSSPAMLDAYAFCDCGPASPAPPAWRHVALTHALDATDVQLHVDGGAGASTGIDVSTLTTAGGSVRIAGAAVDDLRVYAREVADVRDAGAPAPTIAYGNCDATDPDAASCAALLPAIPGDTGGWRLVRHIPASTCTTSGGTETCTGAWYSGTDKLAGTDQGVANTYAEATESSDVEWTKPFGTFNQYMISTVDKTKWFQFDIGNPTFSAGNPNILTTIATSSGGSISYYERSGTHSDPHLYFTDEGYDDGRMYLQNGHSSPAETKLPPGINVFVRD